MAYLEYDAFRFEVTTRRAGGMEDKTIFPPESQPPLSRAEAATLQPQLPLMFLGYRSSRLVGVSVAERPTHPGAMQVQPAARRG